eukprot:2509679-Pyramimonas_sp.AAC.1
MINTDGQISMRAEEDTFLNLPTTSTPQPYIYDEYHTAWIFEKNLIAEEEARGYNTVSTFFATELLGVGAEAPQRPAWYDSI